MGQPKTVWTIGHSTRTLDEFIGALRAYDIELLADVRSYPGSRRYPHFNKEALSESLQEEGIAYVHLPELGGRRQARPDSRNTAWRSKQFRGYADYMETEDFRAGIERLLHLASQKRTAIMCAELLWWRCHRSLIADYLKAMGVKVIHIYDAEKSEEHPFTPVAKIRDGHLSYEA